LLLVDLRHRMAAGIDWHELKGWYALPVHTARITGSAYRALVSAVYYYAVVRANETRGASRRHTTSYTCTHITPSRRI